MTKEKVSEAIWVVRWCRSPFADSLFAVMRAGGRLSGYVILKVEHGNSGSEVEVTLRGKEKAIRKKGPVDL